MLAQTPALLATLDGPEHHFSFTNPGYDALVGHRARLGQTAAADAFRKCRRRALLPCSTRYTAPARLCWPRSLHRNSRDPSHGKPRQYYLDFTYQALRDDQGNITGVLAFIVNVTSQVLARQRSRSPAGRRAAPPTSACAARPRVLPIITFTTDATGPYHLHEPAVVQLHRAAYRGGAGRT